MPLEKCGTDGLFQFDDIEAVKLYKIDKFLCPSREALDFEIQGNFYQSEMKYLEMKLWKCRNFTNGELFEKSFPVNITCKDQATIDNYFRSETLSIAFTNNLFAIDNYEQPIQPFIDDQLFFELDPDISKRANFFIQSQTASLEDDILQLGQS